MSAKYQVTKLNSSWAVVMTASRRIMEQFSSESDANQAREEFETGGRLATRRPGVWVVGKSFVFEADVGGNQLGDVHTLDMKQYTVEKEMTQRSFDALVRQAARDGDI